MDSFDVFYHYDSANVNLGDERRVTISVPVEGVYQVSLANIYVQFDPAYVPPVSTAYLVLDTNETVNSGICIVSREKDKRKVGEVPFPLSNPDQARPGTSVYNFVRLSPGETIGVSYYDDSYQRVKAQILRIVVTIHLQTKK